MLPEERDPLSPRGCAHVLGTASRGGLTEPPAKPGDAPPVTCVFLLISKTVSAGPGATLPPHCQRRPPLHATSPPPTGPGLPSGRPARCPLPGVQTHLFTFGPQPGMKVRLTHDHLSPSPPSPSSQRSSSLSSFRKCGSPECGWGRGRETVLPSALQGAWPICSRTAGRAVLGIRGLPGTTESLRGCPVEEDVLEQGWEGPHGPSSRPPPFTFLAGRPMGERGQGKAVRLGTERWLPALGRRCPHSQA